jgi:S1-C subfamily serine protease
MTTPNPGAARDLGIDADVSADARGTRGLKVSKVNSGSAAEKAGLQVGDMIYSINGYFTEQLGNLTWIIANAAPDGALKMKVRAARDGQMHTLTAELP